MAKAKRKAVSKAKAKCAVPKKAVRTKPAVGKGAAKWPAGKRRRVIAKPIGGSGTSKKTPQEENDEEEEFTQKEPT